MNMEKFGGKKETLVPDDKQEEFAAAAQRGDAAAKDTEEYENLADNERNEAGNLAAYSSVLGASTVFAGVTGNLPTAVVTGALGIGAAYGRKAHLKHAEGYANSAEKSEKISQEAHTQSRDIVQEGMIQGGAKMVEGQLQATPEQIEIARKEMVEKYRDTSDDWM